jgi:uncharacterized protein YukE
MAIGPTFDSLDDIATVLDAHADELRRRVLRLDAAAAALDWESPAARAFRAHQAEVSARLRQCADRLEQAATEFRRHAATARERLEAMTRAVAAGVGEAGHLAGEPLHWAKQLF